MGLFPLGIVRGSIETLSQYCVNNPHYCNQDLRCNYCLLPLYISTTGGVSTTVALVEMTHRLYGGTDHAGNFARLLLLDCSKAFDLANHNILISKLLNIGIPSHIVRWVAAVLLNDT